MDASASFSERPWWRERALVASAVLMLLPIAAIAGAFDTARAAGEAPPADRTASTALTSSGHDDH